MIEYNEHGDAEGCTHNLGPHDMDPQEAWEARRVIRQATDSLLNWGLAMHKEVGVRQAALTDAATELEATRQRVRVLEGFLMWTRGHCEEASELDRDLILARANRAWMGIERHDSLPPRPPPT